MTMKKVLKSILRFLYLLLPKKLRIWGNGLKTKYILRHRGRGRHGIHLEGELGVRVFRGLGSVVRELARREDVDFDKLPDYKQKEWVEKAKAYILAEEGGKGPNTVTDAGVAFFVDDWDGGTTDITNFNYHAMGTGGSPPSTPAVTATALVTEVESRVSGTKSQPAANQFRTVATITATAPRTINEWGLFSASSSGTMFSSRWFTAISLAINDAIEFTYTFTFTSFTA